MDVPTPLVIVVVVALAAAVLWEIRRARARSAEPSALERLAVAPESLTEVRIQDGRLVAFHPVHGEQAVALGDVVAVAIDTDDSGPWDSDLHWIVQGEHGHVVVPLGATGEDVLLAWVQAQPGVDNEAIVAAMGSVAPARFLIWQRPAPVASG
jgi:hypothetical protein